MYPGSNNSAVPSGTFEYSPCDLREGRAELARLGLIAHPRNPYRLAGDTLPRSRAPGGQRRRTLPDRRRVSVSRPVNATMQLLFLAGVGMIASMALIFG
jgi:hypothetical protein